MSKPALQGLLFQLPPGCSLVLGLVNLMPVVLMKKQKRWESVAGVRGVTGVVAAPYQLSIAQLVHRQVIDSVLKQTRKTVKDGRAGRLH